LEHVSRQEKAHERCNVGDYAFQPATLTEREIAALTEFVAQLWRQYDDWITHIWLFGSKMRGDFDEESDMASTPSSVRRKRETWWHRLKN
jgi:hypothetical protein